jgi:formylglycine-generating enzyme required for sulfatase activity
MRKILMFLFLTFACTEPDKLEDTSIEDSAVESLIEIDEDGDGFPHWQSTIDITIADCDDLDPNVNPETERYIPAGSFLRGDDFMPNTSPQTDVYLSDFCLDVYEVTNAQFVSFLKHQIENGFDNETANGQPLFDFEDNDDTYPERIERVPDTVFASSPGFEQHPVTEVWQWSGFAFCEWKNKTLPTEAEWEKGARGTDGRFYPWGEQMPDCSKANYGTMESQCVGDTIDVGNYPDGISPYGLHDMAGNVAEFVSDWYQEDYYEQAPTSDPLGPDSGFFDDGQGNSFEAIIARSGNHSTGPGDLQTFFRTPEPFDATSNGVGFRCARPLD